VCSSDLPGYSITLTFTVYSSPLVIFVNNGTSDICTGENTDLVATGATNYQFFVNGVPVGPSGPGSTFTSPLNNGDVVTVDGESNNCISSAASSYTFVVNTYPTLVTASSDADNIICIGEQVDFTASGAMTYLFALNGATLQNGVLSSYGLNTLADGDVISITGFNGDCASSTDTYTFTVNSMPLALTYVPSSMVCEDELVTFTASGADEYEFFVNGVSTGAMSTTNVYSSSTLNDLDEVTFTGYSTTTLCFQDFVDYVIMNVIDEPTITPPSPIDFCDGDSVILMSNLPYGNQWFVDGSPIASATDTSYVAYTPGSYTLEVNSGGLGDVWSFGANATGTFGSGDNINSSEPTKAVTVTQFDEISSGADFLLAVSISGDVYAWGENSSGQLGDGTYTNTNLPNIVSTLVNIKTIATTESSSMAVSNTGDVSVWGNNAEGQLGVGSTAVINFPMNNAAMANTDSIAGGKSHFVILKNDGTVWAVGNNDYGQLGQGDLIGSMIPVQVTGLTNVVSIGAGEYHSFAIDNLDDLYVWGNNGSGQLGMNDLTNRLNPAVSPLRSVINAQGGANHSAFLTSTDKVYTSGGNTYGQLGLGDFNDVISPVEVLIQGAQMISTGQYTTLVRRNDNSIFGFGNNIEDQLSSSTGNLINTPEHITDLDGVEFIEAGKSTSHVLYLEEKLCISPSVVVTVNTVPTVTITANMDTLTTIAGVSYQWYFNGSAIPGATGQSHITSSSGNYTVEVTFANGCMGTSAIYFHSMVTIDELGIGSLIIYPNPTNGVLFIVFDKELLGVVQLLIVDQTGRIVLESILSESEMNYSLDVSTLNDGLYILSLGTSNGEIREQFIKATF
jgi:alpha-tubulin suppressor-like RCC1 family protein